MIFTDNDAMTHNKAINCHVCEKPLNGDSVKDHCHITGKYRGAAHNACNLKLRVCPKKTAILFLLICLQQTGVEMTSFFDKHRVSLSNNILLKPYR